MNGGERVQRLRWMCRRGMKELDVLLERFLVAHGSGLREGQWPEFEAMLEWEDDFLWDALRGEAGELPPGFGDLVDAIARPSTP